MSSTYGGSSAAGIATAIGLVPAVFSRPKVGTTRRVELVVHQPIMSCSSAIMA